MLVTLQVTLHSPPVGPHRRALSLYSKDNGYLYCWNDYAVFEVKFETPTARSH